MSERKNPAERALDVLVYAPLGLAFEARDILPKLAARGRQQVTMARVLGQFATQQGQTMATKEFGRRRQQASSTLAGLGLAFREEPTRPPAPAADPVPVPHDPVDGSAPAVVPMEPVAAPIDAVDDIDVTALAIPDYDSLAASQVIPRLAGLSPAELEAVRRYESDARGRKTILNKVAQLQSS